MRRRHDARLRAAAAPTSLHKNNSKHPRRAARALGGKDGEGLGDVLRKYGVVALVFHFSVWLTTLSASVAALSVYDTDATGSFARAAAGPDPAVERRGDAARRLGAVRGRRAGAVGADGGRDAGRRRRAAENARFVELEHP